MEWNNEHNPHFADSERQTGAQNMHNPHFAAGEMWIGAQYKYKNSPYNNTPPLTNRQPTVNIHIQQQILANYNTEAFDDRNTTTNSHDSLFAQSSMEHTSEHSTRRFEGLPIHDRDENIKVYDVHAAEC